MKLLSFVTTTLSCALPWLWMVSGSPMSSRYNEQILFQNTKDTFSPWSIVTHAAFPDIKLRFKEPDLCETTEGVKQYAGYLDVENDKHFFFWFFESRSNPIADPTVLWLNGGPGCSSLTGLLMELGPCRVTPTGNGTVINEFSWNNEANLLFLDQPVNVGYSYSDGSSVKDTITAGKDVYAFLQLLFKQFPQFNHNVHVFGESYAGHYIPAIGNEIVSHNKEFEDVVKSQEYQAKSLVRIDLESLGIGNGMVDPLVQYQYYTEMACGSEYGPILDKDECMRMHNKEKTCLRLINSCYEYENPFVCVPSSIYCNNALINPYQKTGRNVYDVRGKCENNNLCYAIMDDIESYLNRDDIKSTLGVDQNLKYKSCNLQINMDFQSAGDWMSPYVRFLPDILESGIRILIYAGDADFICNWIGNKAWTKELEWKGKFEFNTSIDKEWYGKGKESVGQIRTFENFTFLRIYQAGHMVPYDQPEASSDMINGWLKNELDEQTKK